MQPKIITSEMAEPLLNWHALTEAITAGHELPKGDTQDVLLHQGKNTLISRHAWIKGLGALVKTGLIFPDNLSLNRVANLNGVATLFSDETGELETVLDFQLVTKWKTAADSLLAASKLARPDSSEILIIGAGVVASSLIEAYSSLFPNARFRVWARTGDKADKLAKAHPDHDVSTTHNLPASVSKADIIATATMAETPVLQGAWLRPGQHIDLIGAYLPNMREADDAVMRSASIFVDSIEGTIDRIGDLIDPIKSGAIKRRDILGDFYDLKQGVFKRRNEREITLHKNGGGAHLDLMTSRYILNACA